MAISFHKNPRVDAKIRGFVGNLQQEVGMAVTNIAKRDSPIDTGRLRSSMHYVTTKRSAIVRDGTRYGIMLEKGTVKMRPQPFLLPAVFKAYPKIERNAPLIFKTS